MNFPPWKLFRWFRRPQLWATGDGQLHHDNVPTHASHTTCVEFFGETSDPPCDSALLQPIFGTLWLLAVPKTKITFEREEISDCKWDSGKHDGAADGEGELCEVSRCPLWRGLSHHCPVYSVFVSCIFFSRCLYCSYDMAGHLLDRPRILNCFQCPLGKVMGFAFGWRIEYWEDFHFSLYNSMHYSFYNETFLYLNNLKMFKKTNVTK